MSFFSIKVKLIFFEISFISKIIYKSALSAIASQGMKVWSKVAQTCLKIIVIFLNLKIETILSSFFKI